MPDFDILEEATSNYSDLGIFVSSIGFCIVVYFLTFFDTTVRIYNPGTYISGLGKVGEIDARINNIGLMQDKQIGIIIGIFILIIGVLIHLFKNIKTKQPTPSLLNKVSEVKLCKKCGKYYEKDPKFCPNCGQLVI